MCRHHDDSTLPRFETAIIAAAGRQLKICPGDASGEDPPVPIPNTEVKSAGANDTAREAVWESRKSPDLLSKKPVQL